MINLRNFVSVIVMHHAASLFIINHRELKSDCFE